MLKKIFIVVFTVVFSAGASVNPAGQLVTRFGVNGTATLSLTEGSVQLNNVVVDSLQRIIVVGKVTSVGALVARFTPTGQLDTTFNTVGYRIFTSNGSDDRATCVGVLGNIIYVGCYGNVVDNLFVTSFTETGAFNPSWGVNGTYAFNIASATQKRLTSLLVQQDGKLVIGGSLDSPNGFVARINSTGTALDTDFNANGTAGYQVLTNYFVVPFLMFFSNQRIGVVANDQNNSVVYVFTPAGIADTTFNSTGRSDVMSGLVMNSILIQSTGYIIIAGPDNTGQPSVLAKRLTPTGQVDTTFGVSGTATLLTRATCYSAAMASVDNNFFVGLFGIGTGVIAVVGMSSNGSINTSFGNAGLANLSITPYALSSSLDGTMLSVGHDFTNGYIQQFTQYDTGQVGFTNSSTSVSSSSSSSGYVVGVAPVYKVPVTNTDVLPDYVRAGLLGF